MMEIDKIHCEDCLEGLKKLPDNCIDCCVTSPPYFNLRDYNIDGQIGIEETPQEYIRKLTDVFMEVYRVLKPQGTLWLNIGDSYNGSGGSHKKDGKNDTGFQGEKGYLRGCRPINVDNLKPKDLIGIPWMLAFSLRNEGWYLRQDIIWHKTNPMPESVKDRCTKSHEYIFLLTKSQRYFFDSDEIRERRVMATGGGAGENGSSTRNKRDVWTVNTKPDSVAHFATYPEELIIPCILAGCPKGGIVLDPFMGSGTTALVCRKYNRHFVGFEINPNYVKIIERKIQVTPNLFYSCLQN